MHLTSSRVVLLVFSCLVLLDNVKSFSPIRQVVRTFEISAAKSTIPSETVGGYTFAERVVNNVTLTTGGNSTGKPKRTVVSKNPRDWTPYEFRDADGEYDVPFINEAMWYRLSVRRNSEKKLAESLKLLRDSDENWGNMFEEVYYPQQPIVRIKDKSLVIAFKAMAPGLVYIKTKMNPDLADDIESLKGVYAFLKNPNNLVVPLSKAEGESIELMRDRNTAVIDPELMLMKKDEYVSVVSGPRKGRYGILIGAKNGKLEVCLRSEYKDDWDTFEFDQLRYLADPPEKKWMLLTPKEALESLMAKDPYNPTVKAFKKNGLLEEILYPDGRPEGKYNDRDDRGEWGSERKARVNKYDSADESQGREGGRSMRSIAVDKTPSPQRARESTTSQSGGSDMDDWGSTSSAKSAAAGAGAASTNANSFDDSFNIAAWGDSLSSATKASDKKWSKEVTKASAAPAVAESVDGDADFDSFIQGLLQDMGEPAASKNDSGEKVAQDSATTTSSSSSKVIVSNGKREWVPSKERLLAQAQSSQNLTPPPGRQDSRRDSSSFASSKSNDWFDDRSTYDAYGSDSQSVRGSNPIAVDSQAKADRRDSERILNELLMTLDTDSSGGGGGVGSSSAGEVDYFDFSVDSDDVTNGGGSSSSANRKQSSAQKSKGSFKASSDSSMRNIAPKMEDFASFEQYLDALVSHERTALNGASYLETNTQSKRSPNKDFDNSGGNINSRDADSLDDNLVAFLGGEDDDNVGRNTRTSRSQPSASNRGGDSYEGTSKAESARSWNPKPTLLVNEVKAEVENYDDLNSFLDSLEASNVLPSKGKAVEVSSKVVTASVPKVAPAVVVQASSPAPVAAVEPANISYSSLTLKDLKDKLRERGLPVSGNKAELVSRLSA